MATNLSDFATGGIVSLVNLNAAFAISKNLYIPQGIWEIDPDIGIVTPQGGKITGDGRDLSILKAVITAFG